MFKKIRDVKCGAPARANSGAITSFPPFRAGTGSLLQRESTTTTTMQLIYVGSKSV